MYQKVMLIFNVKSIKEGVLGLVIPNTVILESLAETAHMQPGFLVDTKELACYCLVFLESSAYYRPCNLQ